MLKLKWEKHKPEMMWFLDNPGGTEIWENRFGEWELTSTPSFSTTYDYAINDMYADIRKAFKDGKQVMLLNTSYDSSKPFGKYMLINRLFDHIPLHHYKIVNFNIGDWVFNDEYGAFQLTKDNFESYLQNGFEDIKPFSPVKPGDWVTIDNVETPHKFKAFSGDSSDWNRTLDYERAEMVDGMNYKLINYDRSIIKPWKPEVGEWVWLFTNNGTSIHPTITQFREELSGEIFEPFLGKFPEFIKERIDGGKFVNFI